MATLSDVEAGRWRLRQRPPESQRRQERLLELHTLERKGGQARVQAQDFFLLVLQHLRACKELLLKPTSLWCGALASCVFPNKSALLLFLCVNLIN